MAEAKDVKVAYRGKDAPYPTAEKEWAKFKAQMEAGQKLVGRVSDPSNVVQIAHRNPAENPFMGDPGVYYTAQYADPNRTQVGPDAAGRYGVDPASLAARNGLNPDGTQNIASTYFRLQLPEGQLITTDGTWFNSLPPYQKYAINLHNQGVIAMILEQGGDPKTAPMLRPILDVPGISIDDQQFVQVLDNQRSRFGIQTGGVDTKNIAPAVPTAAPPVPTTATNPAINMVPGMTGATVDPYGKTVVPPTAAGNPVIPPTAGDPGAPPPELFGGEAGGLDAARMATILSDPQATLQYLLTQEGNTSPTNNAMYREQFEQVPALYLLQTAGLLEGNIDPATADRDSIYGEMLSGKLPDEAGLGFAQQFLDSQRGAGVDPNAAMNQFLTGAQTSNTTALMNPLQLMGNSGSIDQQIAFAKQMVSAAMVNGNPYMVAPLMTMLDYLGTQYVAQGGNESGFVNWLIENTFFGDLVQQGA